MIRWTRMVAVVAWAWNALTRQLLGGAGENTSPSTPGDHGARSARAMRVRRRTASSCCRGWTRATTCPPSRGHAPDRTPPAHHLGCRLRPPPLAAPTTGVKPASATDGYHRIVDKGHSRRSVSPLITRAGEARRNRHKVRWQADLALHAGVHVAVVLVRPAQRTARAPPT